MVLYKSAYYISAVNKPTCAQLTDPHVETHGYCYWLEDNTACTGVTWQQAEARCKAVHPQAQLAIFTDDSIYMSVLQELVVRNCPIMTSGYLKGWWVYQNLTVP